MPINQRIFPADLSSICNDLRGISEQRHPEKLYEVLLQAVMDHSGADNAYFFLCNDDGLHLAAEAQAPETADARATVELYDENDSFPEDLPLSLLQQVQASGVRQNVDDTAESYLSSADAALSGRPVRSAACLPCIGQGKVVGLLYLEHGLASGTFTAERLAVVDYLLAQTAVTLEQVRHYGRLQEENDTLRTVTEDLAFQRNLLRTLVESVPHRIYAKDIECRFTFANMAVAKGMGASSADDLIGKTDFGFYPDECAAQYMEEEKQIMRSGIAMVDQEEHVNYVLTDSMGWMLTNKMLLRDSTGNVIGIVGINYDITERKRMELELVRRNAELLELTTRLAQAQQQLVQSEKLASIGQLAAGVAHEINNPIGYIFSNFGALTTYLTSLFEMLTAYEQAEKFLDHAVKEQLENLRQEIDLPFLREDISMLMNESREGIVRVQKIVQDLKYFSHVDMHQEWHLTDLHRGIDATLNIINSEVKYKADVVKEYGNIPEVECLPSQISQVVMNLLINAAHAIEATKQHRGTITIRTGTAGDKVWIEVADTGCGIPKENLPYIFDPFYTTKPVGKGTGLGLSLTYGIVQKHQGHIDVTSHVGKGTTFRITLPLVHIATADDHSVRLQP